MYENLVPRFIRYVKTETRSDESSTTVPSTPTQTAFAKVLAEELKEIGLENITIDDACFVMGTLPSNTDKKVPAVGFIAHMDTADYEAVGVNPQVVENYDGKDIVLNEALNVVMSPNEFPNLKDYQGQTLITTDGSTLLGADDKAGIAEIMSAIEYLAQHPEIKHGDVKVAFGPDEEIGRGADLFDVKAFGADYAYTMDGSRLGELEYESFNAAQARIAIKGVSVHPGTAKDKMINASKLAMEFDALLPADEVPEKTEGYEGFFLLHDMKATIEDAELVYIIRDHDREKFNARKALIEKITAQLNEKYGVERFTLTMKDQYYNMREIIEKDMSVVEIAKDAMTNLGIKPIIGAIRGGTDGSKISFMGLPTPNIFTGGENFHGKFEFISVENMQHATDVIVEIIKLNEARG
ncbi:peptidase T [Isobaculum melis]|uniref:Peptidase T n=1 Tax=Isobaculum melis TaxID=142588 RepID=A0A1H9R458_9LACT|nr:peptidase T [Isobaculum melis]SER67516.1 peptidase T. Metallo peptidase. MEROPS family M20B [Isobaculum melis]